MLDDLIEARAIEVAAETHPLCRDVVHSVVRAGTTVSEIVRLMDIDTARYGLPYVVLIRGAEVWPVPITLWRNIRPKEGTRVEIAFPAQEGGAIVAAAASAFLPSAAAAGAGALFAAGTVGYALTYAAITVVGALAINALIPPAQQGGGGTGPQNYAITGVANAANRYGVFPYVIGRQRMFPPMTATGFSETVGRDIYYRGRMTFGWGLVALEDLRIGNTPIWQYQGVELEFLNVDRARTLANMPQLADLVKPRTEESRTVKRLLAAEGERFVFQPAEAAKTAAITIEPTALLAGTTFDAVVEVAEVGSESWVVVETYTGISAEQVFEAGPFSDGVARRWRVRITGKTVSDEPDPSFGLTTLFEGREGFTVTKASATYQAPTAGWRYGAEKMRLYADDVTEDAYNDVPQESEPVIKYTRLDTVSAAIDLTFPQGLYNSTFDGDRSSHRARFVFEYQSTQGGINEADWVSLGETEWSGKFYSLYRVTKEIAFPAPDEYAIRITRTNGIDDAPGDYNSATLTAIRSFSDRDLPSHDGIAEVAFRIKASDQLNGQIDSLNAIVQQLAPVWDGSAWSDPQPVRHPAWAFLQAIRGKHLRRPVRDERIDLEAFRAWATEEPHWTCDYVVDTATQLGEVLDIIAAAGRAKRTLTDLKWSVIRDNAAGPVRQVFTPRNSWGFRAEHRFPREIHGFRVKARSERLEWQEDEIFVLADGFTRQTATELETLDLPGVVVTADDEDEGNVYRLGRYHLAAALNRPATYTLQVGWEHLRVTRGDKVRFVHDVPKVGVGQARIKAIAEDGSGYVASITLDEVFDFDQAAFRMLVRNVGGNQTFTALSPVDPRARTWSPAVNVAASDIAVGDLVVVEELTQESVDLIVTSVRPKVDESAELQLVDAVPGILGADSGTIPTYSPVITEPRDPATAGMPPLPVIISAYSNSLTQIIAPDLSARPRIAVQLAPFASATDLEGVTLQLRWRDAEDLSAWSYGETVSAGEYNLTTRALDEGEAYLVEVRSVGPEGKTRGWVAAPNAVTASTAPPPPPQISATATAASVPDADGNGRRPAISLNWTVPANRTLRVTWQLRIAATGVVVQRGLFAEASEGQVLISDGVLPDTAYQIRASFVSGAADLRSWGDWIDVTTDDLRLTAADLADALNERIDEAFERHDQALEDVESGTVRELLDNIEATFGEWQTFDGLPLIDAIETSIGSLTAPVSLTSEIRTERDRLDLLLPRIYDAEAATSDIAGLLAQFGAALFATDKRISDAGIYVDPESGTVKIAAYEYLEGQVSDVSIELDAARAQIDLKASVAYVNEVASNLVLDPTQIPLLDDLNLRISTAEQSLDAVEGTVTSLTETLTVEGGLVTMTTVTETLDSLQGQITDRVTSATFNAAEARLSAAEQTISAFPDNAEISSTVEASRVIAGDLADASALSVIEMGERFFGDEAIKVAEAQAREDLRSYIDEQDAAVSENVIQLRSQVDNSVAQIEDTLRTRASEAEATAEAVTQLQTDVESADGERAAQADAIDELTGRVSDTETGLVAETADRTLLASRVRAVDFDLDDLSALSVGEMWAQFKGSEDLRAGIALAASELHTYVEEGQLAEASERLQLGAALADAEAEIVEERIARTTQDEALAQGILQLSSDLENVETATSGNASAISGLTTRVADAEGALTASASDISDLQAGLSAAEGDITGNASAIAGVETRVTSAEGTITSQASDISDLQSGLSAAEGGITGNASAISGLDTRVDSAEGVITSQGSAISSLQSGLTAAEGDIAANGTAVSNLTTRVTSAEGSITSISQDMTTLQSELSTAEGNISANGGAISGLDTRVTSAEGTITSQGQAITSLQSDVTDAQGGVSGNASAISNIDTRVSSAEGSITAQASDISQLQSGLSSAEGDISGNASAIAGIDTRVTNSEGEIASQAGRIDGIEATLNTPGTGVLARISTVEGTYVDASGAVSAVEQEISASYGDLSALASATAFAKAQADGISAGYVWRLNGQGVLELVSVSDGTGGTQVTAEIDADYVRIRGLTQIDSAVIAELVADDVFTQTLTVGTINFEDGSVVTGKLGLDAATIYGVAGSGPVTNDSSTPTTICNLGFPGANPPPGSGILGAVQIRLDDVAGNYPSGFEIFVVQNGTRIAEYIYSSAQADPTARIINMPISRTNVSASDPNVFVQMRNMGGKGVLSSNLWALVRKR